MLVVASLDRLAARSAATPPTAPNAVIDNLNSRIKAWWVMVVAIGIAFAFGKAGVIVLFAFASFTALREFITLMPTPPRRSLLRWSRPSSSCCRCSTIWSAIEWYGLYSIFIPVYAFLLLPIVAALRGDTTNFMRARRGSAVGR